MKKFEKLESDVSYWFHSRYIPLLISAQVLRRRSMGQIDVSWFERDKIIIAECKSGQSVLINRQKKRLISSTFYLGCLFNKKAKLIKLQSTEGFANSCTCAYPFKISQIMELT